MNLYEKTICKELYDWEKEMLKRSGVAGVITGTVQTAAQSLIPQKAQEIITTSVRGMTEAIMTGSALLANAESPSDISLGESDYLVERAYKTYNRLAIAQGFGFGLGGALLGLADFPALLAIKIRFLFDCANFYGYDVNKTSERLFMLYVFQLAFCGDERRRELMPILKNWDEENPKEVDWETFQKEYRDYIDLAKLLQLLPVIGSIAGGTANHSLLKNLKVTAMNCYRLRRLKR